MFYRFSFFLFFFVFAFFALHDLPRRARFNRTIPLLLSPQLEETFRTIFAYDSSTLYYHTFFFVLLMVPFIYHCDRHFI
jgi:hypothetical protein